MVLAFSNETKIQQHLNQFKSVRPEPGGIWSHIILFLRKFLVLYSEKIKKF